MPEARDRLARREDLIAVYSRRWRLLSSSRGGASGSGGSGIEILADVPEELTVARTPFRWRATAMTGTRVAVGVAARGGVGRTVGPGTPRNGRGRSLYGSPATGTGRENVFPESARDRGRRSVLPSWYPRTPLRDVTFVMRAIERRRPRLGEDEGLNTGSPLPQEQQTVPDPSVSTSGAQLEHDVSIITPRPTIGLKSCPLSVSRVPKLLLDITSQDNEDSAFLTPQKKLLNSIDTVEKAVMEELQKLKRTPTAQKAEREKRVRTLMSMR